jgi:hypothetical protein
VPLFAIIASYGRDATRVRVEDIAGSLKFPLLYLPRPVTVGTGVFITEENQQGAGIFWSNMVTRQVYRRMLSAGSKTIPLFRLSKGYRLVRGQNIHHIQG